MITILFSPILLPNSLDTKQRMDAKKPQQKIQAITQVRAAKDLKRGLLLILLPVSILSIILSYYPFTTSLLYNLQQFISRKTMFLFCNAILLFVVVDSGLLASSSSLDSLYDEFIAGRSGNQPEIKTIHVVEEKPVVEIAETLELVRVGGEQEGEEMGVDDSELVGVEESQDLGVDELNKRCDEFIKRMKREIMESQQVVMV